MNEIIFFVAVVLLRGQTSGNDICSEQLDVLCALESPLTESKMEQFLPTADFLDTYCPAILQTLKCIASYNDTCGVLVHNSPPITFQSVYELVTSACDEESAIGRGYRKNIDCVNSIFSEPTPFIRKIDQDITGFIDLLSEDEGIDPRNPPAEVLCIGLNYASRIVGDVIRDICGEEAQQTLELIKNIFMNTCPNKERLKPYADKFESYVSEKTEKEERRDIAEETIEAFQEEVSKRAVFRRSLLL